MSDEKDRTTIKIQRERGRALTDYQQKYKIDLRAKAGMDDNEFNIYVSPLYEPIIEKMESESVPLGNIAYCTVGINTGYIRSELLAPTKLDERYHPVLNRRDIERHRCDWSGEWIMYDPEYVKSRGKRGRTLPPERIFSSTKILLQRTRRGLKRKLVACLDTHGYYNLNRASNVVVEDEKYGSIEF